MWVKDEIIKYAFDLHLFLCQILCRARWPVQRPVIDLPVCWECVFRGTESSQYNPSGKYYVIWFSEASEGTNQIRVFPVSEEVSLLPAQRHPGSRDVPVTRSDWELPLTATAPKWRLPWITWIQSTASHLICLSSHLCLDLSPFYKVFVLRSIRIKCRNFSFSHSSSLPRYYNRWFNRSIIFDQVNNRTA